LFKSSRANQLGSATNQRGLAYDLPNGDSTHY
jgi:hypothetical protein